MGTNKDRLKEVIDIYGLSYLKLLIFIILIYVLD